MRRITWRRFFESKLFFAVGIGFLILLSVNLTRSQLKDRAIRREISQLRDEMERLEKERVSHEAFIALLETPEFLEKEARSSLGYALPGEKVVVIEKNEREEREEREVSGMSNPRKWWVYFFGP